MLLFGSEKENKEVQAKKVEVSPEESEVMRSHSKVVWRESDLTSADSVFREQQDNQQEVLSKTGSGRSWAE